MNLREKLVGGKTSIGIFSKTLDSAVVEAAGHSGLDFIILDMEHGPSTLPIIHNHVRAARLTSMASIVRVRENSPHMIGAVLDSGADGVQVPNISTADQAREAVKAARFYPTGTRGVCRFVRAANYGSKERATYFSDANKAIVVLQVEGIEGVRNLEEILNVEGFDVLFIGPYDLSQSVGRPGEIHSPEVQNLIADIACHANQKNKALGIFCDTASDLVKYKEFGLPYIAYSVDLSLFREAVSGLLV